MSMLNSRTLLNISTVTVVLAASWNAAAQAQPAAPTPSAAPAPLAGPTPARQAEPAPPAAENASAPSAESTSPPTPEWKKAMTLYEIGEVEKSLDVLRAKILSCENESTPACTDSDRAALYMCIGIVLAGGQNNHNGGVQAFKKALSLDDQMRVAPEFSIEPVTKAFSEAYTGKASVTAAPAKPAPRPAAPQVTSPGRYDEGLGDEDDEDDEPEAKYDPEKGRLFWMATGGGRYGVGQGGATTQVGGALAFAGLPGETSGFTLGARVRSGAIFSSDPTLGYLGMQMLIGGTTGPRKNNQFTFITGAVGFENYFGQNRSALTGHFFAGTSLGGLIVAGGVDVALGDDVAYALFGLEIGFGMLLL